MRIKDALIVGAAAAALALGSAAPASAQIDSGRLEIGAQVPTSFSSEFDTADVGAGARLAWRASRWLGVEAEINLYPRNFPGRNAFSGGRVEGLFGPTLGPRLGRVRPFGKLRPGFLQVQQAPDPVACIAIFPPPLACTLAAGRSMFALDVGGGVEVFATPRTLFRVDAGDLMVRYPGPARNRDLVQRDSFFSHDFRFAAGVGFRF